MNWRSILICWACVCAGAFLALLVLTQAMDLCIDRRDYAPGRNTYRIMECTALPSYHPGEEARAWNHP